MSEPDGERFGLVMPFVAVVSRGGPYDDLSYAAGWEMGALDIELGQDGPRERTLLVRAANGAQAELIAMRHGYATRIVPYDDHWAMLQLQRSDDDRGGDGRHRRPWTS